MSSQGMEVDFWLCSKCTFHNGMEAAKCEMCQVPKPPTPAPSPPPPVTDTDMEGKMDKVVPKPNFAIAAGVIFKNELKEYKGVIQLAIPSFLKELVDLVCTFLVFEFQPTMVIDVCDTVNKWYESTIRDVRADKVMVHYNGWASSWDEWIPVDSERLAPVNTHTSGPRRGRSEAAGAAGAAGATAVATAGAGAAGAAAGAAVVAGAAAGAAAAETGGAGAVMWKWTSLASLEETDRAPPANEPDEQTRTERIAQLANMGFDVDACTAALRHTGWNLERAAARLTDG